jgi:hypothetical protein
MLWPNQISTASPHTHVCARPLRRFFTSWSLQDKTFKADVLCENGIIKAVGPDLKVRIRIEQTSETTDLTVSSDHACMHRTTNTRVGGHIAGVTAHMSFARVSKPASCFCMHSKNTWNGCVLFHALSSLSLSLSLSRRDAWRGGCMMACLAGFHTHTPMSRNAWPAAHRLFSQNCPYSQHYLTRRTLCIILIGTYMRTMMVFTWQNALVVSAA